MQYTYQDLKTKTKRNHEQKENLGKSSSVAGKGIKSEPELTLQQPGGTYSWLLSPPTAHVGAFQFRLVISMV